MVVGWRWQSQLCLAPSLGSRFLGNVFITNTPPFLLGPGLVSTECAATVNQRRHASWRGCLLGHLAREFICKEPEL